jgi:hypothetical protein
LAHQALPYITPFRSKVNNKAQGPSRLYQNKGLRRAQLGMMQVKAAAKCIDLFQIFISLNFFLDTCRVSQEKDSKRFEIPTYHMEKVGRVLW